MKWILSLVFLMSSLAMGQTCGGDGQPICEFAPATKQTVSGCQAGEFADLTSAKCWTCPEGYARTLAAVTAPNACAKTIPVQPYAATKNGSVACLAGEFLDIGRNECWQCPTGYDRTLDPVTAASACAKSIPVQSYAATKTATVACQAGEFLDIGRNECWECPSGYSRTAAAVTAGNACATTQPAQFLSASSHGPVPGCAAGQFTDPLNPGCWSCPAGYNRTVFPAVTAADACQASNGAISVATNHGLPGCASDQFFDLINGGTCWSCPAGSNRTVLAVNTNAACEVPSRVVEAPATLKRSHSCPAGQIFDAIDGGTCWTCPSGTNRTVFAVNTTNACEAPATTAQSPATLKRSRTCPSGQIFDAIEGGTCWSCPSGTNRTVFAVNSTNACEASAQSLESVATAKRDYPCPAGQIFDLIDGGTCWTCPSEHNRSIWPIDQSMACTIEPGKTCNSGLSNLGGTCRVKDACGGEGQRPCTVLERIPSCDAKLYEDFKEKKCLPIKDGESPFLMGLGSLAKSIVDVRTICEDALRLFPKIQTRNLNLDGTETCAREFGIGFICATTTLAPDLSKGAEAAKAISTYYQTPPCSVPYAESLTTATRHGNSRLLSCPAGQFFDLIDTGSCWSCPEGWQRTLYPVNSAQACSRGEGVLELFRGFCAVGQYVESAVVSPIKCLDALFKDGFPILQGQSTNVETVGRMCNLTGEFTLEYTAKLLLGAASIENPVERRKRLMDELTAIQTGLNSSTLVDRITTEPACKGFLTDKTDTLTTNIAKRRNAQFSVRSIGHGGLKIELPEELGLRGELRRLDGSSIKSVQSPGVSLPEGTLRSGVYTLTLIGRTGGSTPIKSYLVTVH